MKYEGHAEILPLALLQTTKGIKRIDLSLLYRPVPLKKSTTQHTKELNWIYRGQKHSG